MSKRKKKKVVRMKKKTPRGRYSAETRLTDEEVAALDEMKQEFLKFAIMEMGEDLDDQVLTFMEELEILEERQELLGLNLTFGMMASRINAEPGNTWIKTFTALHRDTFKNAPFLHAWFREWKYASLSFFEIAEVVTKESYAVTNLITGQTHAVYIEDPFSKPPVKGNVVMGVIMPASHDFFSPFTDFYHFDPSSNEVIKTHLKTIFKEFKRRFGQQEASVRTISAALKIEQQTMSGNTKILTI